MNGRAERHIERLFPGLQSDVVTVRPNRICQSGKAIHEKRLQREQNDRNADLPRDISACEVVLSEARRVVGPAGGWLTRNRTIRCANC
jgi:hypothetical protein